jgi:AraC-like DNA-binding protein
MKQVKKLEPNAKDLPADYPLEIAYTDLTKVYESLHWHDCVEVVIVNNGVVEIQASNKSLTLQAGQGVIIAPNAMHSLRSVSMDSCSIYDVHFKSNFIFSYEQPILANKYQNVVFAAPSMQLIPLQEGHENDDAILDLINDLIAVNLTKKIGYDLQSRGILTELWVMLLQQLPEVAPVEPKRIDSLNNDRVRAAITYIEENYAIPLTLEDIADSIHISKSECCRCFKKTINLSPIEYLMKYRIYVATKILIENPDIKSISDLAFSSGFNNSSYFNKVFREYTGTTPTRYRKKIREAAKNNSGSFQPYKF